MSVSLSSYCAFGSTDPYCISDDNQRHNIINKVCEKSSCDQDTFIKTLIRKSSYDPNINEIKSILLKPDWGGDDDWWLSNLEIDRLQKQLQHKYPHYTYLKTNYSSFFDDTIKNQINTYFSDDQIKYIGVVLNTALSGSGVHWYSIFIDKVNNTVEHYNSSGDKLLPPVKPFVDYVLNKLTHPSYKELSVRHQESGGACGVYAINYIWLRLSGKSFDDIQHMTLHWKKVSTLGRRVLFMRR